MVRLGAPMLMLSAPVLWFAYFLAIYGVNALACRFLWPAGPVVAAETSLTLLALGGQALPLRRLARGGYGAFYRATGLALGGLSLLATLWVGAMVWMVPPCA